MITSIKRDFNLTPNIVGIVTDDNLNTMVQPGYFSSQSENIELINKGAWQWEDGDIVLINYFSNRVGFFIYDDINDAFAPSSSDQIAIVSLTSAQIKGMYASPVQLLPEPGIGYMYKVDSIVWSVKHIPGSYTGGGNIISQYANAIHAQGIAASSSIPAANLTGVGTDAILSQTGVTLNAPTSSLNNVGLYLSNDTAPFASGNSTVQLSIKVHLVPL